ncbi:hypothetical protein EBR66_06640, partial [bacterium]|nr:hypothetical protein [bacterium]
MMFNLSSARPFKSIARETPAIPGLSSLIELGAIPAESWKKYDGNPNWAMKVGGETVLKMPGQVPKRMIQIDFHLIGRTGKKLKTEEHLVPFTLY